MSTANAELLTIADVCKRTKLGKSRIFDFLASGELESAKFGTARRITEEQLADFIARRVAASKATAQAA